MRLLEEEKLRFLRPSRRMPVSVSSLQRLNQPKPRNNNSKPYV